MEAIINNIPQNDGTCTKLYCYQTSLDTVLGNVLVLHGMAEHSGRYLDFIQKLTEEGFDVYTYDHRGHGAGKTPDELGFIAEKNGHRLLIEDAHIICQHIKKTGRSDKLSVFGHSMGSMILRCLIQEYDDINSIILSSSTMPPVAFSKIGGFLAGVLAHLQGPKTTSSFLQNLMFGGKAYTGLCTRTSFDWLTRSEAIIDIYMDDPCCGFVCTTSFYRDLANLAILSGNKNNIAKTRRDLPILFLTGEADPVGGCSKQIIGLHNIYKQLSFINTDIKIYPGARHELINEPNAPEVYADIVTYLKQTLC